MPYLKKIIPQPEPIDCRILTAALDLFVQQGYHNISIHEIQKQAQVSIGSIYNYFGGKEGIARALYQHILNELDQVVDEVIAAGGSPIEQCKRIIADLFGYTETHRNIIAFIFHAKHAEFLPEEPRPSDSSAFTKMRAMVERGMECGEFRQMNTWVAAAAMFGGAIHLIQLRLDGQIERPLPEYLDAVLLTAKSGLCMDTEAQSSTVGKSSYMDKNSSSQTSGLDAVA